MRERAEAIGVVLGAILGGIIVGPFRVEPTWLWGILGGVAGGLIGGTAAHLGTRSWPLPLRFLAALAVVSLGFFALWLLAGRQFVLDAVRRSIGG